VTVHCHKEESIALMTAIRLDSCLLGDSLLLVVFTFYDLFRVQQSSRSLTTSTGIGNANFSALLSHPFRVRAFPGDLPRPAF
jgi:hypothetical protein